MEQITLSKEQFEKAINHAFKKGEDWGVTYFTYFNPSEEETAEKINSAKEEIIQTLNNKFLTPTDANNILVDGRLPIFHVKMDMNKFGLSEKVAMLQDMAEEYAVVADKLANAGLIVYGKFNGVWRVNPWSIRFLIRILLENSGVSLPPLH